MKSFCYASRSFNRNGKALYGAPDHIFFLHVYACVFAVFLFHIELLLFSDFLSSCSVDFQYHNEFAIDTSKHTHPEIAGFDWIYDLVKITMCRVGTENKREWECYAAVNVCGCRWWHCRDSHAVIIFYWTQSSQNPFIQIHRVASRKAGDNCVKIEQNVSN